jgi:hypothetical protein
MKLKLFEEFNREDFLSIAKSDESISKEKLRKLLLNTSISDMLKIFDPAEISHDINNITISNDFFNGFKKDYYTENPDYGQYWEFLVWDKDENLIWSSKYPKEKYKF